jgi:hypothetical protein
MSVFSNEARGARALHRASFGRGIVDSFADDYVIFVPDTIECALRVNRPTQARAARAAATADGLPGRADQDDGSRIPHIAMIIRGTACGAGTAHPPAAEPAAASKDETR